MTEKLGIAEEIGEAGVILPELVNRGLAANDRLKFYLTLLQGAREHAEHPDRVADLRVEREAVGIADTALDEVSRSSRSEGDAVRLPQGVHIRDLLARDLREMLRPLFDAPGHDDELGARYERRIRDLTADMPGAAADGDLWPLSAIDAVGRAATADGDSVHQLVMDLHRELNRLQGSIAAESIDGAKSYGLTEGDRPQVHAFMRGLNATAALKFDHPGLATAATRVGKRLTIQNDLGETEAHVLVLHIEELTTTVIYTDVHRARLQFFQKVLEGRGVEWSGSEARDGGKAGQRYEMIVGRMSAQDAGAHERYLEFLGSRLVFLIDWNKARKLLQRLVGKSDAVALLEWAADHNLGHRGFLQADGLRLVSTALQRGRAPIPYGARLDELLGRAEARAFLQSVLRLTSEGLRAGRSPRLIQDEVEAELLTRLETSDQGVYGPASEHATFVFMLAEGLQQAIVRVAAASDGGVADDFRRLSELAKRWETRADEIVANSRRSANQSPAAGTAARFLADADNVADALEDAAFFLTLLPDSDGARNRSRLFGALAKLADLSAESTRQYVRVLEYAKSLTHLSVAADLEPFLVAVDQVVKLEHEADAAEREAQALALEDARDFRDLFVLSTIARALEDASDGLDRCVLATRDRVLTTLADHS